MMIIKPTLPLLFFLLSFTIHVHSFAKNVNVQFITYFLHLKKKKRVKKETKWRLILNWKITFFFSLYNDKKAPKLYWNTQGMTHEIIIDSFEINIYVKLTLKNEIQNNKLMWALHMDLIFFSPIRGVNAETMNISSTFFDIFFELSICKRKHPCEVLHSIGIFH